jgi:hypothetical protein
MPDQKLNLPHKVFAAIERLVSETPVSDVGLDFPVEIAEMDFTIPGKNEDIDLAVPAEVSEIRFDLEAETREIVEELAHPAIMDAAVEGLDAAVKDEKVDAVGTAAVYDEPMQMGENIRVIDVFKTYHIDSKFYYTASVKSLGLPELKPNTREMIVDIASRVPVKENVLFFKRLTVQQKPVVLTFLSEKDQLVYWRQAVLQTKKEARKLELVGVYKGVPYDFIEHIKVNYSRKALCYNYNLKALRAGGQDALNDVALFTDLETKKTIVVMAK